MRLGALAGVLTTFAAVAVAGALAAGHHGASPDRGAAQRLTAAHTTQLAAWESAVHPIILSAGQVVALGPRQGAQQLQSSEFSSATNQHMAAGWVARLTQLRAQLHKLQPPPFLGNVQTLLDRSLAGYIDASRALLAATTATVARRVSLINAADAAGQAADRLYDQATAAIAAQRATLGLPVDWSGSS